MEITKGKLKKIIKEEMQVLADTGDVMIVSESEKKVFEIILEKLNSDQLKRFGLKRI